MTPAAVITIDGPSGTGKGTVAHLLAQELGWHILDSGALYRIVGVAALDQAVAVDNSDGLVRIANAMEVDFSTVFPGSILLDGKEISGRVRLEESGVMASRVATNPALRTALLQRHYSFRRPPGLVADGRDMGTVIFPEATLKVFLTASVEARAERRYKQLIDKGFSASMADLLQDLRERDERDTQRVIAPLKPAEGAKLLDTSHMSIDQAVEQVLGWYHSAP